MYEKYTVKDSRTGFIIESEIIDWNKVEELLAQETHYEYLTDEAEE